MAQFKEAVLTRKGIALLAKAQAENTTITFTRAVTGDGEYEDGEDLASSTALKSYKQEFAPTTIRRQNDTNVYVRFSITNNPTSGALANGYYVMEIGLMANDPDDGEILYALAIADQDVADYLPAYDDLLPAVIGVDFLIEVDNAESVTITTDLSAYATNADLNAKADHIVWDEENQKIQLKANGEVISECIIEITNGSIATEQQIDDLVEELMSEHPTPVPDSRIATDEEIEDAINSLEDL